MKTISFFTENTQTAFDVLNTVIDMFPCFVNWKSVEMNYLEISIMGRLEDIASIEKIFSEIV